MKGKGATLSDNREGAGKAEPDWIKADWDGVVESADEAKIGGWKEVCNEDASKEPGSGFAIDCEEISRKTDAESQEEGIGGIQEFWTTLSKGTDGGREAEGWQG